MNEWIFRRNTDRIEDRIELKMGRKDKHKIDIKG